MDQEPESSGVTALEGVVPDADLAVLLARHRLVLCCMS